jgi:hypothetical protein
MSGGGGEEGSWVSGVESEGGRDVYVVLWKEREGKPEDSG